MCTTGIAQTGGHTQLGFELDVDEEHIHFTDSITNVSTK